MNLTGCMKNQLKIAGVSAYEVEQLEKTYSAMMDKEMSRVAPAQQTTLAKAIQPMFFADYAQNTEVQRDAILAEVQAQHPELTAPKDEPKTEPTPAEVVETKDHGKVVLSDEANGYLMYEDGTFDEDTERMFQQFLDVSALDEERDAMAQAIRNAIMADGDIGYMLNLGWPRLRDKFYSPPGTKTEASVQTRRRRTIVTPFWENVLRGSLFDEDNTRDDRMRRINKARDAFGKAMHQLMTKDHIVELDRSKPYLAEQFDKFSYDKGLPAGKLLDKMLQLLDKDDPLRVLMQKFKSLGTSDVKLVFMYGDDLADVFTRQRGGLPPALATPIDFQRHGETRQVIVINADTLQHMYENAQELHGWAPLYAHEFVHAMAVAALTTNTKLHYEVTKLLHAARKQALKYGGWDMHQYGLTDVHEFLAEAFTNAVFQEFLSSIPMDGKELSKGSLWDKLKELIAGIANILTGSEEYTMLDHLLRMENKIFLTDSARRRLLNNPVRAHELYSAMRDMDSFSTAAWRGAKGGALQAYFDHLVSMTFKTADQQQVAINYAEEMGLPVVPRYSEVLKMIKKLLAAGEVFPSQLNAFFAHVNPDLTYKLWDKFSTKAGEKLGNAWVYSEWDKRARLKNLRKNLLATPGSIIQPINTSYQEQIVFLDTEERRAVVQGRRNFIAELNRLILEPANKLFAPKAGTPFDTKTVAYSLAQENKQSADAVLNTALAMLDARDPLRTLAQGLKQTGMRGVHTLFGSAGMWKDLDPHVATAGGVFMDNVKLYDQAGNYLSIAGYNLTTMDALSETQRPEVIFHELVHAVTLARMRSDPAIYKQVEVLLERARRHAVKVNRLNDYGLANPFEFVAEAFTSSAFQEFLMTVPSEGTSTTVRLWQDFLDFVRNIAGVAPTARNVSMLDDVIKLQSTLFQGADDRLATQGRADYAKLTKERKAEAAESRAEWESDRFSAKIHMEERRKRGLVPPAGWTMPADDLGPDFQPAIFRNLTRASQHDLFIPGVLSEARGAVNTMLQGGSGRYARNTTGDLRNTARKGFLGLFTMDQLVRTYRKYFDTASDGNPLIRYWDIVRKKVTYAREHQEIGERINRKWRELETKHPAAAMVLSKLMLDTTLSEIHPDIALDHDKNMHLWTVKRDAKKGDRYVLKKKTTAELYANLARQYNTMPPEAKEIYQQVKDYYNNQRVEMRRETLHNIFKSNGWDHDLTEDQLNTLISQDNVEDVRRLIKLMRPEIADEVVKVAEHAIRGTSVDGPYFPLRRYGDYVVEANRDKEQDYSTKEAAEEAAKEWRHADPTNKAKVKKMNDTTYRVRFIDRIVSMHETESEAREFAADLAAQGYHGVEEGMPIQVTVKSEWKAPPDSSANVLLTQAKKRFGDQPDILKALDTAFLELLLDNSMKKSDLVRHKIKGASTNMRRAFAERAYNGSWAVADVMTAWEHAEALRSMNRAHRQAEDNNIPMGHLFKEIQLRDQRSLADRKVGTIDRFLANFGFAWILASPSYAAVNATQVPLVALPYLYAKYGKAANTALFRSYRGVFKAGYKGLRDAKFGLVGPVESVLDEVKKELTPDEVNMIDHLTNLGIIDATFARELYATSKGGTANRYVDTFMNVARGLPQATEIVNRVVVARTAFHLAKAQGQTIAQATEAASEAVLETQFDYCVDAETECLTTEGWKFWHELEMGDTLIGTDDEGRAVETPLLDVNTFYGARKVLEFDHAGMSRFSMVVTKAHDCVVQNYNSRDKKWQRIRKVPASSLKGGHHLLRAPLLPVDRKGGDQDFAALLGWVAAEGDYGFFNSPKAKREGRRTRIGLAQSLKHNPQYVEEIEALLQRLGGHYRRYTIHNGELAYFTLKRPLSDRVREAMPDKLLTPAMLKMSTSEMTALLDAFSKGDGHFGKTPAICTIGQKNGNNLDVLQAMAVLLGRVATRCADYGDRGTLYIGTTRRSMVKEMRRTVGARDFVWCPTTETGTWIARRNGAVFVTGNSDTNKPRYFKGFPGARAIMMFKMYAQGMYALLIGNAYRALNAQYPQERKQAKKALAGIITTHTMAAGVLGGLFAEPIRALTSMAAFLFEDDDEPWDLEAEVAGLLSDLFGVTAGDMMARGLPRGLGIDLSARVGLNNLAFMDGPEARSHEEWYTKALIALLGPMAAVGGRMARGLDYFGRGEYAKGIENVAPRFLRDPVKAWRVGANGMTDYNGNVIQPGEEFGLAAAFSQTMGFTPAKAALTYEARGAQRTADVAARDARKAIIREWRQAAPDKKSDVFLNKVLPYNRRHPMSAITRQSLIEGMEQAGIRQARTVAGYSTKDPKIREKGRFAGDL